MQPFLTAFFIYFYWLLNYVRFAEVSAKNICLFRECSMFTPTDLHSLAL